MDFTMFFIAVLGGLLTGSLLGKMEANEGITTTCEKYGQVLVKDWRMTCTKEIK